MISRMISEWKEKTTVKPGGRVEVVVPDLNGGETVEVVVRRQKTDAEPSRRSGFGSARGRVVIRDDFEEPLEGFRDYM